MERNEDLGAETGAKFDGGKNRLDLIPPFPIWLVGLIWSMGAIKYDDNNWRKGIPYSRIIGSAWRHFLKWLLGEENDKESGLPHLAHVIWNMMVLLEFTFTHPEMDDRLQYPKGVIEFIEKMDAVVRDRREEYEKEKKQAE